MPVEITNSGNPSVKISISRTGGGGAPYDDTELRGRIETLEDDVDTIEENVPFKFGIDENGNYGYYKEGADSVTPFKTGGGGGGLSASSTSSCIVGIMPIYESGNATIPVLTATTTSREVI